MSCYSTQKVQNYFHFYKLNAPYCLDLGDMVHFISKFREEIQPLQE